MVNSIGRIEIKWLKIVNENLTANHQQFNNWIKQLRGLEWNSFLWSEHYQKKATNDDNVFLSVENLIISKVNGESLDIKPRSVMTQTIKTGSIWRVFCIRMYYRIQELLSLYVSDLTSKGANTNKRTAKLFHCNHLV